MIIHEILHSLGLSENPPSSDEITKQVLMRCGGGATLNGQSELPRVRPEDAAIRR